MDAGALLRVFKACEVWEHYDVANPSVNEMGALYEGDIVMYLGQAIRENNVTLVLVMTRFGPGWVTRWSIEQLRDR